jgi:hypothetical protein
MPLLIKLYEFSTEPLWRAINVLLTFLYLSEGKISNILLRNLIVFYEPVNEMNHSYMGDDLFLYLKIQEGIVISTYFIDTLFTLI